MATRSLAFADEIIAFFYIFACAFISYTLEVVVTVPMPGGILLRRLLHQLGGKMQWKRRFSCRPCC
eukprot:SAG25_NODE_11_length_28117_cov_24.264901_11_plen_66_part_00